MLGSAVPEAALAAGIDDLPQEDFGGAIIPGQFHWRAHGAQFGALELDTHSRPHGAFEVIDPAGHQKDRARQQFEIHDKPPKFNGETV